MGLLSSIFSEIKISRVILIIYLLVLLPFKNYSQVFATKYNDLDFGDVFIGYPAEVNHVDATAAKFRFIHLYSSSRDMQLTFSLPKNLIYQGSKIQILFDADHSAWSFNDVSQGRTNFNPHSPLKIKNVQPNTSVFVWFGGKIRSTSRLQAGVYQGTIIVTVEVF